ARRRRPRGGESPYARRDVRAPPDPRGGARVASAAVGAREGGPVPPRDPGRRADPHLRVLRGPAGPRALLVSAIPREPACRHVPLPGHADPPSVPRGARLIDLVRIAACGLVGYGVGSISSGSLVGRVYRNVDLRKV